MTTVQDIVTLMESWAPRTLAWDRDNVGLLIGSAKKTVRTVLVALDVTEPVIEEGRKRSADLIITHHPLIFGAIKSITDNDRTGVLVAALMKNNIALYAAHTNLDFTKSGVSAALAEKIGLSEPDVLQKDEQRYQKIVVFVPLSHFGQVMHNMTEAGAGHIGKYDACTFRTEGTGTFRPLAGSHPYLGTQDHLESVAEARLEMICPIWKTAQILEAMRKAHPYEEAAYDVYNLANVSAEYGAGLMGALPKPETLQAFLRRIREKLEVPALRFTGDVRQNVQRIAVCGGGGADLLPAAISRGADAFVTADIKYHTFQAAEGRIALIDAGHFETEIPIVQKIVSYLVTQCCARDTGLSVLASRRSRNPIQYSMS